MAATVAANTVLQLTIRPVTALADKLSSVAGRSGGPHVTRIRWANLSEVLRMLGHRNLYSVVVFTLAICPVTVAVGVVVYLISRLDGMAGSPAQAVGAALGFAVAATLGHVGVVAFTARVRARFFADRSWAFPLCCGLLLTAFTLTGLVENSTDVVGRIIGHRHEHAIVVASVLIWSAIATGVVAGFDRFLNWLRHGQIA